MRNRMQRPLQGRSRRTALVTATLLVAPVVSIADQIVVYPSQDNTLYEDADGSLSNGAGDHLFAGRTDTGLRRRAVLWFDLSVIPEGSVIEDAALWMNLSRSKANDEIVSSIVRIRGGARVPLMRTGRRVAERLRPLVTQRGSTPFIRTGSGSTPAATTTRHRAPPRLLPGRTGSTHGRRLTSSWTCRCGRTTP